MINIVFDTNVLVASLLKQNGVNQQCLLSVFSNLDIFNVCFSSQIMDEYEDVLSRPIIRQADLSNEAKRLLDVFRDFGYEIVPKFLPAIVYPDIKDRPFLEACVYVDGVLITNNLKDFPFVGVNILAPEEFLEWKDMQPF